MCFEYLKINCINAKYYPFKLLHGQGYIFLVLCFKLSNAISGSYQAIRRNKKRSLDKLSTGHHHSFLSGHLYVSISTRLVEGQRSCHGWTGPRAVRCLWAGCGRTPFSCRRGSLAVGKGPSMAKARPFLLQKEGGCPGHRQNSIQWKTSHLALLRAPF